MGKYKIIRISTIDYGKYRDVLRIIAKKQIGFFASLFSSSKNDTYFILSKESPLTKMIHNNTNFPFLGEIDEKKFKSLNLYGTTYFVELDIDKYESDKERRIEKEKKESELKAQKEREENDVAEKRNQAEEKRHINKVLGNSKTQKVVVSNLQMIVDENDSFSNQMATIAGNANLSFLSRNQEGFQKSIIELYNNVHGYNSHKLKTISAKDGQCIGLAFIKMALFVSNGDFRVNEIAAQNAFYCIVKNFKSTGNKSALPALFTLLLKKPRTLEDELYKVNEAPQLSGLSSLTPTAQYTQPIRAMSNRLPIMKFLLQKFYDENLKKFIIDVTIPYHIPSDSDVKNFISEYNNSEYASKKDSISLGEKYLYNIYEDIEEQLNL